MRSRFSVAFCLTAISSGMGFSWFALHKLWFAQRSPLDTFLVVRSLEDALHVNAGGAHMVWLDFSGLDQVLDFDDRHLCCRCHHGIEVLRRLAIHQIAPTVALPGFDEREVGFQCPLQHIRPAIKLARLFALGNHRPESRRGVEGGDPRSASANAFGEGALRNEFQIDAAGQHHLFQQAVFADVASLVRLDLASGQHQPEAKVVNPHVVADGVQILHAFLDQGADEVLGDPAQAEAPDHERVAIFDAVNGLICVRNYFVHCHSVLIPTGDCTGASRLGAKDRSSTSSTVPSEPNASRGFVFYLRYGDVTTTIQNLKYSFQLGTAETALG